MKKENYVTREEFEVFIKANTNINNEVKGVFGDLVKMSESNHNIINSVVDLNKSQSRINDITLEMIVFVIRALQILFLFQILFLIELFLKDELNIFFSIVLSSWGNLSEGWQIFLIGIPVGLILQVIGHFLIKYFTKNAKTVQRSDIEDT